jgi:predicted DNA-binding transcriptional regulator AlpA
VASADNEKQGANMQKVMHDIKEVAFRYLLSERTIYRMIEAGKFPRPRKCGALNRWHIDDLAEWEKQGARTDEI